MQQRQWQQSRVGENLKSRKKPADRTAHVETICIVKTALVDEGISRVVSWLNRFEIVNTHYSCEGHDGDGAGEVPYVMFSCPEPLTLMAILSMVRHYAPLTEVDLHPIGGGLRYTIRFGSKQHMREFVQEVIAHGPLPSVLRTTNNGRGEA